MEQTHPGEKREKFYTVSARLIFSGVIALLVVVAILGASVIINNGPILPLLGVIQLTNPIIGGPSIGIICTPTSSAFGCINPAFNATTGLFTVAMRQTSGYNWTLVTVRFVAAGTTYSQTGVPILSWSPPLAVNITGGLANNVTKYVTIPVAYGPVSAGTNITGSIWAKYQLGAGKAQFYANMSSAIISVK